MERVNMNELWECGGASTNSGVAVVYCGPHGEKLRPIERAGSAGGQHARFAYVKNMIRIECYIRRGNVESIEIDWVGQDGTLVRLYTYFRGEWKPDRFIALPGIEAAKVAAENKANEYHCRQAVYAL